MSKPRDSAPQRKLDNPGGAGLFLLFLCLTGFAITEPLLSIFGANPGIFVFYSIESFTQRALYAFLIAVVPAAAAWAAIWLIHHFNKGAAAVLTYFFVAALAALWAIQLAKWQLGLAQPVILASVGVAAGAVIAFIYFRIALVRAWMRIAAIAPVIASSVFLFASETSSLGDLEPPTEASSAKQTKPVKRGHPSVLFVLLDEFPTQALLDQESAIDALRYPNLAALADESTWYKHYSVLAGRTSISVPSILSGQEPKSGFATAKRYPTNLFALLAPSHHLTVFEALTDLCSYPECSEGRPGADITRKRARLGALIGKSANIWLQRVSLGKPMEAQLDDFQEKLIVENAEPVKPPESLWNLMFTPEKLVGYTQAKPERLERLRDTFTAYGESALYFVHVELPHIPWRFYPDGKLYDAPVEKLAVTGLKNGSNEWLLKISEYRFIMQARYTDHLVGQLISRLKVLEMWDDMLVVVTADHGRSFKPNSKTRLLHPDTLDGIAYAPLLIKSPQQREGVADTSNLMSHDLLPTMADILNIDLPWQVQGVAAGDPKIALRGDEKFCYPLKTGQGFRDVLDEKLIFSDAESFPQYSNRWIGEQKEDGNNLALLNRSLKLDNYFGRAPDEFKSQDGGVASIEELDRLKSPGTSKAPLGMVMGNLEFEPEGDKVLIAVNGVFVTASPLFNFKDTPHTFLAMLPDAILTADNEVEVYLVVEGQLQRLTLT